MNGTTNGDISIQDGTNTTTKSKIVEYIEEYNKTKKPIMQVEDIMNKKFENMK